MEDFAIIVPNIALVEMTCRQTMISMAYWQRRLLLLPLLRY